VKAKKMKKIMESERRKLIKAQAKLASAMKAKAKTPPPPRAYTSTAGGRQK
jgi:hypothetical protein